MDYDSDVLYAVQLWGRNKYFFSFVTFSGKLDKSGECKDALGGVWEEVKNGENHEICSVRILQTIINVIIPSI